MVEERGVSACEVAEISPLVGEEVDRGLFWETGRLRETRYVTGGCGPI